MEGKSPPPGDGLFAFANARKRNGFIKRDGKVLVKSTAPPPKVAPRNNISPNPKKRIQSFATIVASATGTIDGKGTYSATLTNTITRKDGLDTSNLVTLYQVDVLCDGKSWSIYRRYKQFVDLDRMLKRKGVIPLSDNTIPKKTNSFDKPKPEEVSARMSELATYLNGLFSSVQVAQSHYFQNFLEPTQVGDTKKS